MVFNSIKFAIFLLIVFLVYWFACSGKTQRQQNLLLLIASYTFYAFWDWRFLGLIVFTTLCSYACGLAISFSLKEENNRKAKMFSTLNIVINLLILGVFKYYNFFVSSFTSLSFGGFLLDHLLLDVALPVGISFYTFSALSYTIDVYKRKQEATKDIIQFAAYVSFFPQLLAGPIGRSTELLPQYSKPRTFSYEEGADGMRQILWGLFKKVVVADNCAIYVDQVWDSYSTQSGSTLLLSAIMFSFQIYADFSGYSDMAIGTAKLFGIKLRQNFNVPYFSRDVAEFWRRWHISLTNWFRDYIYIPIGGSRCSKGKFVRNTFVIFLVSGLWHGANWTYFAWGTYHAVLFLPLILLGKNKKHKDTVADGRLLPSISEAGQLLLTFLLATLGWIIFRAESIGQAWDFIQGIFCRDLFSLPFLYVGTKRAAFFALVMVAVEWFGRSCEYGMGILQNKPLWVRIASAYVIILVVLEFAQGSQSFIYFQF